MRPIFPHTALDYYISPPTLYLNILSLIRPPVCLQSQLKFYINTSSMSANHEGKEELNIRREPSLPTIW